MICTITDCDAVVECRGFCLKHYTRWLRHGDPLFVRGGPEAVGPANHGWKPDEQVTYRAMHKRLARLRGPASNHACIDCGGSAAHWSYIGAEAERISPDGYVFSTDLDAYAPRCLSCHKRHDAPAPPHCPRGHDMAGTNLLIRKDGSRQCRICKKAAGRQDYLRRRALETTPLDKRPERMF